MAPESRWEFGMNFRQVQQKRSGYILMRLKQKPTNLKEYSVTNEIHIGKAKLLYIFIINLQFATSLEQNQFFSAPLPWVTVSLSQIH